MTSPRTRPLLLTDADCGFCQRAIAVVPRLGVDVDIEALQNSDLVALGVDVERAYVEMAGVGCDGEVHYGHRAYVLALATGPWFWRLVGRFMASRVGSPIAAAAYRWVSTNRHRLPGGSPTCRIESTESPAAPAAEAPTDGPAAAPVPPPVQS